MNIELNKTLIVNNYYQSNCKMLYNKLKEAGITCQVKDIPSTKTLNWSKILMADCMIRYQEDDKEKVMEVINSNETSFFNAMRAYTSN